MIAAARIELIARRALDDRAQALLALEWYAEAKALCAEWSARCRHATLGDVVGIVAALSPQSGWLDQLKWTSRILQQLRTADFSDTSTTAEGYRIAVAELSSHIPGPGFNSNKRKAARIWLGEEPLEVLSGPKVRAFYVCIMSAGQTDQVCIDRHAWSLAVGLEGASLHLTPKRYRETVAAYSAAAALLRASHASLAAKLTAPNVQALTWIYWRGNPEMRF